MKSKKYFWHKITVRIPEVFEEKMSSLLVDLGAEGVWVEEAGDQVDLNVYFPDQDSSKDIQSAILKSTKSLIHQDKFDIACERLPEEEWQTTWQVHSIPIQLIGEGLQIIPEWEKNRNQKTDRKTIILSPGMAFGTGTHATTHACLIYLEALISKNGKASLLDVGTGSGILAIAAAKLGLNQITAVEIDSVALEIAKKNARKNRVISKIMFRETIPPYKSFQYIVSNVTAPVLLELSPVLTQALISGGFLILSGILSEECHEILAQYEKSFLQIKSIQEEGWSTLLMQKK